MLNWVASLRKKEKMAFYRIPVYLLVLRKKGKNMPPATERKMQLISLNQSTYNTPFYVHPLKTEKVNSITRNKICYHQSSINVEDLIS